MAIWNTKVDARAEGAEVQITDEPHVIGEDLSGLVQLNEIPLQATPSTVVVPEFTEVSGAPAAGEFRVLYDVRNRLAGTLEFNAADNGRAVTVSYLGRGSALFARDINRLQSLKQDNAFSAISDRTGAVQVRADGASTLRLSADDPNVGVRYDAWERQVSMAILGSARSPQSSTNLLLWLDASRIALPGGTPVQTWQDLSGMNHHFVQSDPAKRPILRRNAVGGRSAVRFDGVDDVLVNSTFGVASFALYMVVARNGGVGLQRILANQYNLLLGTNNGELFTQYGNGSSWTGTGTSQGSDSWLRPGAYQFVGMTQTGSTESVYLQNRRITAAIGSTSAPMASFSDGLHLGGDPVSGSQFWNGDIVEIVIVSTSSWDKTWDRYFITKYGMSIFDPLTLSGVLGMYDAGALDFADGTPIATWPDRLGTGRNLTQSTVSRQPVLRTGVAGGRSVVRFDGVDDVMSFAADADAADIFMVLGNYVYTGDNQVVMGGLTPDEAIAIRADGAHALYGYNGTEFLKGSARVPNAGFRIFNVTTDGTSATLRGDGVITARVPSSTVFTIGQVGQYRNLTTSNFLGADVAEILMYNRVLNFPERKRVEQYLADKYGLPVTQTQPADVPGLRCWLDASRLGLADGAPVAIWPDLSPTEGHVTQGTVERQPVFRLSAVAGQPAVEFDGVDDFLGGHVNALAAPFTVFVVGYFSIEIAAENLVVTEPGPWTMPPIWGGGGGGEVIVLEPTGSETLVYLGTTGTGATASISRDVNGTYYSSMDGSPEGGTPAYGPALPGRRWTILTAAHQATDPKHLLYRDSIGQTVDGYATPVSTIGRLTLGADFFETNHFQGQIAEVIVYDHLLSDEERGLVEGYLGSKYSIDLLP